LLTPGGAIILSTDMKTARWISFPAAGIAGLVFAGRVFALSGSHPSKIMEGMVLLVFQLAVIVLAAHLGGSILEKLGQPAVIGEIVVGVLIGPYLLGAIPLPGFPGGLFPLRDGFPLSGELYGFATVASIVLLFLIGLETNVEKFLAFSLAGSVVGIGGALASFFLGAAAASLCSEFIFGVPMGLGDPLPLFLGAVSASASVGLTARILAEKRKVDSPEGATILTSVIVGDVISIILVALVIGLAQAEIFDWRHSSLVALRGLGIWIVFTILGLVFSRQLGNLLKRAGDHGSIALMSFALALLLAGIFERSGLAMIVGAYVAGLALAGTDISFIIRRNLSSLKRFFVPLFFCVMGMLVDPHTFLSWGVILFGLVYLASAFAGKLIGCGLPALFFNFNLRGAGRIGVGMIPRGEVALIMAGIGLALGIIPREAFGVAVMMTVVSTLLVPPWFSRLLESDRPGMRKYPTVRDPHVRIVYDMPNPDTSDLVMNKVLSAFFQEGFFVQRWGRERFYQIRKDDIFISLLYSPDQLIFDCRESDSAFIHTLFYEVLAEMEKVMQNLQGLADASKIGRKIFTPCETTKSYPVTLGQIIRPAAVKADLRGTNKREIIEEMLDLLVAAGQLEPSGRDEALRDLLQREEYMSTGMQNSVALPHAKTSTVTRLVSALGLKKKGIDFNSLDGKPARIILLTLSPRDAQEPYLQFMARMSQFLRREENRRRLLEADNDEELHRVLP